MENFQVDVILSSLQDLNKVRERNEKQLAREYAKRVQLQNKLEAVTSRHSATSMKKTQAQEALKVVSEQSSIAEAQASSLEQTCREKREEVRAMNDKMEEQRRLEEEALSEFSAKMTELADNFRSARAYYTEPKLISEVESCSIDTQECRDRVSAKAATLSELQRALFQLQHQREVERGDDMEHSRGGVTKETWQTLLDMVVDERGVAKTALESEEEKLRSLQTQNKDMSVELRKLSEREDGEQVVMMTDREE